jgi:uncharacterized protein YbjQ (UPF0145 family)
LTDLQFNIGLFLSLLVLGYFAGTYLERRHFISIRQREQDLLNVPAVNFRSVPRSWQVESSGLAAGSVVVSVDYFKRFLAGLRILIGGRVKTYETLLDRGRREALLRMKEQAIADGYDAIINVRLETSRLANANGQGTAGVEILAYGTAVKLANSATV